jgi:hypothetical protein
MPPLNVKTSILPRRRNLADTILAASLLRPDDLLSLQFEFVNLSLDSTQSPPSLIRTQADQPAFVSVVFAPQHISEQFVMEGDTGFPINAVPPPVAAYLAGRSLLAFQVPDTVTPIPFTLEGLLSWTALVPSLAPNALAAAPASNPPGVGPPGDSVTFIELPYRLMLSPDITGGWKHALDAVTRENHSELWHTRLGVLAADQVDETKLPPVRAIWARDLVQSTPEDESGGPLNADDRQQIVHLTSDFTMPFYTPPPLDTRRLMLSALGAWLDTGGSWDFPDPKIFNLTEWRHLVSSGRDQYVRVVERGYLFPFGNRAAKTTITERKLAPSPNATPVEYLMQRDFITVQEPFKDYTSPDLEAAFQHQGRELPLRNIRIATLSTPPLDLPISASAFPIVNRQPFQFHIVAEDVDGQQIDFNMPLMFVNSEDTFDQIQKAYSNSNVPLTADLRNQLVAFAPSKNSGDTHLKAASLTFAGQTKVANIAPPFLPSLVSAVVSIPAIDNLLGSTGVPPSITFCYHPLYLDSGFQAENRTETFATLNNVPLSLPAEKFGGLMSPQTNPDGSLIPTATFDGLSRSMGPVPEVKSVISGTLGPVLNAMNVKLLGGFTVKDVVSVVAGGLIDKQIPSLVTRNLPTEIRTTLHWQPDLQILNNSTGPSDPPPLIPIITSSDSVLTIDTLAVAPLDGRPPSFTVNGSLTNFGLNLFNIIVVSFDALLFIIENGKKPDVTTEGVNVEFVGALSFLNQLAELMPPDGFSDPPSIQVTPDGLTAGYSLGLPAAGIGAFSLENIALSAEMVLPFIDEPVGLRLAFSERFHPFLVTVSFVGGGGFLAVVLTTSGIESIEGSMEIGGNVTLSLGIIEVNAHVMIGFHFGIRTDNGGMLMDFTAYIRVGASVDLLGLVGISIDIYLGLGFTPKFFMHPPPPNILGVVSGVVSVTVGVHLLFFDKAIQLTLERSFEIPARANIPLIGTVALPILKDPPFDEMISPEDWQQYCEAFA